jgi:hypothetical protein
MVQTDRFKKFLEVLAQLSRLTLEVMLDGHYILLVGAICFLIVVVGAGSNYDPLGALLLPLFVVFVAFLSAIAGSFGRCPRLLPETIFPSP